MKKLINSIPCLITLMALAPYSHAVAPGSIFSPASIFSNNIGNAGFNDEDFRMIDHSGLSTNFVNGVTDFNTYLTGNPTHTILSNFNEWFAPFNPPISPGVIIFDLGGTYTIDAMAIWNEESGGVKDIALYGDLGLIGNFLINSNYSYLSSGSYPAQVVTFTPMTTQYVALVMNSVWANAWPSPSIGELAFRSVIPEPATYASFLGIGSLVGLRALKRFKRS